MKMAITGLVAHPRNVTYTIKSFEEVNLKCREKTGMGNKTDF